MSGYEVVKGWLGFRMKQRSGRKSSPLDEIHPTAWIAALTTELLELLWVLEASIAADFPTAAAAERSAPGGAKSKRPLRRALPHGPRDTREAGDFSANSKMP